MTKIHLENGLETYLIEDKFVASLIFCFVLFRFVSILNYSFDYSGKYSYDAWRDKPELIPKGPSYFEVNTVLQIFQI